MSREKTGLRARPTVGERKRMRERKAKRDWPREKYVREGEEGGKRESHEEWKNQVQIGGDRKTEKIDGERTFHAPHE